MKILLLHQNFPGQFRQLAPYLASHGHELTAVCSHDRPLTDIPSLRLFRYQEPSKVDPSLPYGSQVWHEAFSVLNHWALFAQIKIRRIHT